MDVTLLKFPSDLNGITGEIRLISFEKVTSMIDKDTDDIDTIK